MRKRSKSAGPASHRGRTNEIKLHDFSSHVARDCEYKQVFPGEFSLAAWPTMYVCVRACVHRKSTTIQAPPRETRNGKRGRESKSYPVNEGRRPARFCTTPGSIPHENAFETVDTYCGEDSKISDNRVALFSNSFCKKADPDVLISIFDMILVFVNTVNERFWLPRDMTITLDTHFTDIWKESRHRAIFRESWL